MKTRQEIMTRAFPTLPIEMAFKILDNLDNESLLWSCRLVSRGWCKVSSLILQDRRSVTVKPWCSIEKKKKHGNFSAYEQQRPEFLKNSLAAFIKFFKNSRGFYHPFPFANFELQGFDGKISECPDVGTFFALSKSSRRGPGLVIKGLRFSYSYSHRCPNMLSNLERLVFQGPPCLRTLCIRFNYKTRASKEGTSNTRNIDDKTQACTIGGSTVTERSLPYLKILQIGSCYEESVFVELVTKILRAAPNLQRIESSDSKFHQGQNYYTIREAYELQPLIDANKLHLVHRCTFKLDELLVESGLVTREKLLGFQPRKLKLELFIRDNVPDIRSGARELLWTVKDAVEELKTDPAFGLLDILDLPQFSKLKVWKLECVEHPVFPSGRRNFDPFPQLEKIRIFLQYKKDERTIFPAGSIPSIPVIPSVQSVEIEANHVFCNEQEAKGCFQFMAVMCPNIRNLEFSYSPSDRIDFSRLAPLIWTSMSNVQALWLGHRYGWSGWASVESMEAGFTGFSLETVRQLKATGSRRQPKVDKVQHLRVNPSILMMTELKKLMINADNELYGTSPSQVLEPILPLSFKYGFNLMPGLIVEAF